jgi:ribosome biogenesis GTPase A
LVQVQWFPGHMTKARRLIEENLKIVDVVLELADARVPESSRNPLLKELTGDKPRLLVLTKEDLADRNKTREWRKAYDREGLPNLAASFTRGGRNAKKDLTELIRALAQPLLEKRQKKGIINKTVRIMVVGIPNVGKSTLINFLAGRTAAETGDKPGVTKGKQWIRLANEIELLDMPGLLWPKIEDPAVGLKLAATGAIGEQAYDQAEVALWLLGWLVQNAPGRLAERYGVAETPDTPELMRAIGARRGFLLKKGEIDTLKTAVILLDELRGGKLGGITFDEPPLPADKEADSANRADDSRGQLPK